MAGQRPGRPSVGSRERKRWEECPVRHIFIINPSAGKKRSTKTLVERIQALDAPCEIHFTEKTGDARRIARAAAESGEAVRIYACGGGGPPPGGGEGAGGG